METEHVRNEHSEQSVQSFLKRKGLFLAAGIVFLSAAVVALLLGAQRPPESFPVQKEVVIEEGNTIKEVTDHLKDVHVVRSGLYLQTVLKQRHENDFIQPGVYTFPKTLSVFEVADAITTGTHSTPLDTNIVTFPEGFRIEDMKQYLPSSYQDADVAAFKNKEGYLFPDTYFIKKDMPLEDIVALMEKNFEVRLRPLQEQIDTSYYSLDEIVTLASILEREGNTKESMRTIAGILLTRLENDMPLQVDASLGYINGKTSAELTQDDLASELPHNTYRYIGLPPTPISNPGRKAIEAVLDPIETDYLFYLSDDDGNFHYATNFEEHKRNKQKYLQ